MVQDAITLHSVPEAIVIVFVKKERRAHKKEGSDGLEDPWGV